MAARSCAWPRSSPQANTHRGPFDRDLPFLQKLGHYRGQITVLESFFSVSDAHLLLPVGSVGRRLNINSAENPPEFSPIDSAGVNPTQIWLPERSALNIKCPLVNKVSSIQWFKDGKRLIGENAIFYDQGTVSREDSGFYQCLATNSKGSAFSWGMNVTVVYIDGFAASTETSEWLVKDLNSFVIRPPAIKSSPNLGLSWRWFIGDEEISTNDNYYVTTTGTLVAINPKKNTFNYKVQVRDLNSGIFVHNYIVKQDPTSLVRESKFQILYGPTDQTLISGRAKPVSLRSTGPDLSEAAIFECIPSFQGILPPEIKWFIDAQPVLEEINGIHLENEGRRLIIYPNSHLMGPKSHTAKIKCAVRSGDDVYSDYATAELMYLESPKIDLSQFLQNRPIFRGDNLRLSCPTEKGWPRPKISWYHDGKLLENSPTILKVNRITENDYGIYQCVAKNSAGLDLATTYVHEPDDKMFVRAADESSQAFEFQEQPEDVFTKPGKDVLFKCKTSDPHNSRISWRYNDEALLMDNPRLNTNLSSLVIHDTHKEDSGVYTCVATNQNGQVIRASAVLDVSGSQLIQVGPSNQSLLIGTNIKMPCIISEEALSRGKVEPIWSKNGQLIPKSGDPMRRVSIDEDGQLTINQVGPDSIGVYKCTVKSGMEEESVEASLQIIERPGMPVQVQAQLINDSIPAKIKVSWRPGFDGNSPLIKHAVEMRFVGSSGLWNDWETVVDNVNAETCCSVFIDNVRPSSTAEFRVVAFNVHGPGRPSLSSNNVTMPQSPPAASPRSVAASPRTSNSVMVQWQPPPPDQWNGDILGYNIRYRLAGYNLPWQEKNVSKSDARNALLEQLITWRDYEVQVAAFNNRGLGVYSKPIEVQPLEGTPMEAPHNVQVTVLSSTEVLVEFDPLDQQMIPGVNQGYKIDFWKGEVGGQKYRTVKVVPDQTRLREKVEDLEKFGHYNMTVVCYTNAGDGPRSDPIEVVTEEDVPGPVPSISFDQVQFSSVVVQWEAPVEPNGVLIKYILRHWETSKPDDKQTIEVTADQNNVTVEGLKASTQYSVDIQALTKVGASPRTEAKFESGVPPELPGRPSALTISDVGPRSAVLQFIPGFDGHSYIKKWIVEAKVGSSTVFTQIFNITAPKARSFTINKLRPFTKYQVRLIAENIRGRGAPSDPSRSFETQATEPENAPEKIYAEPVASDRIQLVWTPLLPNHWNGEPRGYVIYYRAMKPKKLGGNSQEKEGNNNEWITVKTLNHKASEMTLLDLEPFTTYQIRMAAENSFGLSETSTVITATTYESSPSEGPESVIVDLHQSTVRIQWDEVPLEHRRGMLEGYKVELVPEDQNLRGYHTKETIIPSPETKMTYFQTRDLRPATAYRVFVSAYNLVGEGPPSSESPLIHTPPDIPEPPIHVKFSKISNNSLILKWEAPLNPNGVITNYVLRHWKAVKGEESAVSTVLPHSIYQFSAASLSPDSNYIFGIKAQSEVGVSKEVQLGVITTNRKLNLPSPKAPISKTVDAVGADNLWWHFEIPEGEGEVREVEVQYQRKNQDSWNRWRRAILPAEGKFKISDLIPNMAYRTRIRYIGDNDDTTWSAESDWAKTLGSAPKIAPGNVRAKPYEASSILLEWNPINELEWNADQIGYKILYRIYQSNNTFLSETLPLMERNPSDGVVRHVIHKLSSFHHYIVQVQSYNKFGTSQPSKPPAFVYVGYSIPKQDIKELRVEAQSSTSMEVHWKPWESSDDDVISGYRVRYSPLLSSMSPEIAAEAEGGESLEEVVVTENNSLVLTELRKFTEYQISVSGYNRAGDGQASVVRARTLEDTPGPVGELQFSDILLDSVNVSWTPPQQTNGRITGYSVTYRTYKFSEDFRKEIQEKTLLPFLLADNLEENTTYSFTVQARTSVGLGVPVSGNVTIGYNRGAPGAPTKPIVLPEQSSFLMKWSDGPEGTTPIKGYLIQAKRVGIAYEDLNTTEGTVARRKRGLVDTDPYRPQHVIGEWVTISNVLGTDNEYRISYRQLEPSSYYVFRLFARNNLGIGLPSEASEQLHVPASIPEDPIYTTWWFLIIVALVLVIIVMLFVFLLCMINHKSDKKDEKSDVFDTHQLADGFVVSYELQNKNKSPVDRPQTHTSWLSNENLRHNEAPYGSIASGLNNRQNPYSTSSVYHALATDNVPEIHRNSKPVKAVNPYASKNQLNVSPRANNYWAKPPVQVDIGPYGTRVINEDPAANETTDDAEIQAEKSFAGHYQSNPQEENYRATWKRSRETERQRAQSGRNGGFATNNHSPVYLLPNRPDSEATNETGQSGSDDRNPSSLNSQRDYEVGGINLRTDFTSPKHQTFTNANGFSSFV
ncbi:unnamed protein product [Bursaphelenchus xylophilus]|uniref:(pine wood nematode) hypothetical protein n=1 Tax=Bursaphelenchus xylophilus TaxID=6326 RepID=A0A1I7RHY0_BURXY|nr:unnamed protein product [Bursaphelenchus xylophilus]CAG9115293.1 unnamed protein product [Bursaphelenchus xylophilus]